MNYKDKSFKLVVFDQPHLIGKKDIMFVELNRKEGKLKC